MLVGELTATITLNDAGFMSGIARARAAFAGLSGVAASQGQAVGANFAQGIASGISANTGAIQAAARAAAASAAAAARAALQIQSPSKVASLIGNQFGQGLANGIGAMQSAVRKAAETLAHAAAIRAQEMPSFPVQPGRPARDNIAIDSQIAQPSARPTVLLLDGKEVARTLTEDTNQSLGGRARQLALGYGG